MTTATHRQPCRESYINPGHCCWCGSKMNPEAAPGDVLGQLVQLIRTGHEVHIGPSHVPGKLVGEIYAAAAVSGQVTVSARCVIAEGETLETVAGELVRLWLHPSPVVCSEGEVVGIKSPSLNSLGFAPPKDGSR